MTTHQDNDPESTPDIGGMRRPLKFARALRRHEGKSPARTIEVIPQDYEIPKELPATMIEPAPVDSPESVVKHDQLGQTPQSNQQQ